MYMVHNGHLPEESWQLVKSLASDEVPVLALAPHVAASMANRSLPLQPDWILPIYPFQPANPCTLEDVKGGRQCIRGFSVQGRIEQSRRNYTQVRAGRLRACGRGRRMVSSGSGPDQTTQPASQPPSQPARQQPTFLQEAAAHRPPKNLPDAQVWEQIGGHRRHHTSSTVSNFRLNILGETVEKFSVPGGAARA
jgi:hypothetical protein